jgi:hypothetical protein
MDHAEAERLHRGGATVRELAQKYGSSQKHIVELLKANRGVPNLYAKPHRVKHPEIRELLVGEHVDLPRPPSAGNPHNILYMMARRVGIRVSVRALDERIVRVTRVADAPKKRGTLIPIAEMIRLRQGGGTLQEIAERAGLSPSGVWYHLAKHAAVAEPERTRGKGER